jgi:hypothetical protein
MQIDSRGNARGQTEEQIRALLLLDDFVTINTLRLGVDAQNTVHHEAAALAELVDRPMLAGLICRLIVVVMPVGRLRSRSGHRSGESRMRTCQQTKETRHKQKPRIHIHAS